MDQKSTSGSVQFNASFGENCLENCSVRFLFKERKAYQKGELSSEILQVNSLEAILQLSCFEYL